jgi:hypothetical protein
MDDLRRYLPAVVELYEAAELQGIVTPGEAAHVARTQPARDPLVEALEDLRRALVNAGQGPSYTGPDPIYYSAGSLQHEIEGFPFLAAFCAARACGVAGAQPPPAVDVGHSLAELRAYVIRRRQHVEVVPGTHRLVERLRAFEGRLTDRLGLDVDCPEPPIGCGAPKEKLCQGMKLPAAPIVAGIVSPSMRAWVETCARPLGSRERKLATVPNVATRKACLRAELVTTAEVDAEATPLGLELLGREGGTP